MQTRILFKLLRQEISHIILYCILFHYFYTGFSYTVCTGVYFPLFPVSVLYRALLTRMNWVYHNENISFYVIYSWLKSYVNCIHFLPVNPYIQCVFFCCCLFWWSIALWSGERKACEVWKFYPFLSILLEIWHTTDLQSSAQLVSNINYTSGVLSCCQCILFINASFSTF